MSRRIVLKVAYDGTEYAGWQRQKNGMAIQQILEETVEKQFHESVHIVASGRTDAGVHARGQIAAMTLEHEIPVRGLMMALNSRLPDAIRIMDCWEAIENFNPRYDAKRKTYRYTIYEGQTMLPQYRSYAALASPGLNWTAVEEMLRLLVGVHDYAAFQTTGSSAQTTIREIYEIKLTVSQDDPAIHYIDITGNGFLYNMVRIIAGTALDVGKGRRSKQMIEKALETGDRKLTGPTAPAQGLTLMNVEYAPELFKL